MSSQRPPNANQASPSGWTFLVDEDLSPLLAQQLQAAGYSALHVNDAGLSGQPDTAVFAFAQAHQQTVITEDVGFGNIRIYPSPHFGIVLVQFPPRLRLATRLQVVLDGLAALSGQSLASAIVVIEPGRVRVRH